MQKFSLQFEMTLLILQTANYNLIDRTAQLVYVKLKHIRVST